MTERVLRRRLGVVLACAAGLASACATPYDPFQIPSKELRERVRTIALFPLRADSDVADRESARAAIEPLVAQQLTAGGFRVVASDEVERLWRAAAADVGDLYDPVKGKLDEERHAAVEAAVEHELRTVHGVDGVFYMRIYAVDLYLTGSKATFCGTTDPVYWRGGETLGFLEGATFVRAACLGVWLHDMEERELYSIRSGLEVIETYARQTAAIRPPAERLQNPARLREAVEATVGPLAGVEPKR